MIGLLKWRKMFDRHKPHLGIQLMGTIALALTLCSLTESFNLSRAVFWKPKTTTGEVECANKDSNATGQLLIGDLRGMSWYLRPNDSISASVISTNDYDVGLGNFIRDKLSALGLSEGIFVDIGANVGIISASALQVGVHVVAVEALPDNAQLLQCSAILNGYSHLLTLHNRPLTSPELVDQKYCVCRPPGNPTDGILVPLNEAQLHEFCGETDCESALDATTIDQLGIEDPVSIMKVDVEGLECLALSGAHSFLTSNLRPCVIVAEFNPSLQNKNGCTIHHMVKMMAVKKYAPYRFLGDRCASDNLLPEELNAMDSPGTLHNICWMPTSPPERCM